MGSKIIRHRKNRPAVEYANGNKAWFINGKVHREEGPAFEYANGTKMFFINNKLHREDGPAIEYSDGIKKWYINGELYREDRPKECYINKKMSEWEYKRFVKLFSIKNYKKVQIL